MAPEGWNSVLESPPDVNAQRKLRNAGVVMAASVGVVLGLTFPFVAARSKLPYMATPKQKIEKALRFALSHGNNKSASPPVFLDLGSGDGEAVYQAAKLGYRAIGVEMNYTLWLFSSIRRHLFFSSNEKARSSFILGDMFQYHVSKDFGATTVMIFGIAPLMSKIGSKLQNECSPGTQVVAYRFSIPSTTSPGEKDMLRAKVVYEHAEMKVYEKIGDDE